MNLEKPRSSARATFKNPNFLYLCELRKKLGKTAFDHHSKNPIGYLRMNWEKLSPSLNFTVENKMGSLHNIRLVIFQT